MIYLKHFNTHSDYQEYITSEDKVLPNVSYCDDQADVHYVEDNINPDREYLTFVALDDHTAFYYVKVMYVSPKGGGETKSSNTKASGGDGTTSSAPTIQVSFDSGQTWSEQISPSDSSAPTPICGVTLNIGQTIMVKGNHSAYKWTEGYDAYWCQFSSDGYFDIRGNIMSLINGDDFEGTELSTPQNAEAFYSMFKNDTTLRSIKDLVLPTSTSSSCYQLMFSGCTNLVETMETLPATSLTQSCYTSMFAGCTSLATAPALPATTLADYCYQYMFDNCSSLNYIKAMFTTEPETRYTYKWVENVAATGTFVKNAAAFWSLVGDNGVPDGWTIESEAQGGLST